MSRKSIRDIALKESNSMIRKQHLFVDNLHKNVSLFEGKTLRETLERQPQYVILKINICI